MTRKKVKLAFIVNDSERKTSYMKRKKSLLKKMEELSTLCGIEACAIVYSPDDPEPVIWPSEKGVQNVLGKFSTMPEWEKSKKMVNQQSFTAQSILKGKEQVEKLVKDNKEKAMTMFMIQCLNAGRVQPDNNMMAADLYDFSAMIEQKLNDISRRLEALNVNEMTPHQPQMQIPALVVPKTNEMTLLNYGHGFDMNANRTQNQWFMDLNNGNGNERIMPQFGDANLQLQTAGFWPNPLP